jgi:hypothetical protein
VFRSLSRGALDLLVPLVTDQHDVQIVLGEPPRLVVHLRYQWAGGVDGPQTTLVGFGVHHRRDSVGGKHDECTLGHVGKLLHEDGAALFQVLHDMLVVHDLLANVDGCSVPLECLLHGHDSAIHARAIATRCGKKNPAWRCTHSLHARRRRLRSRSVGTVS